MPGLDALAGVGSAAEQLFIWGVLQSIIGELMRPYLQAIDNRVLASDPNVPLSPAQLAGMVVRGHIAEGEAATESAMSGLNADRLHKMVLSYGNPPGPEALAEAFRRGFIEMGQIGDETPTYRGGIAQGDLQNIWADVILKLAERTPGPTSAVDAEIRNFIDPQTARQLYSIFGGDTQYYDLMLKLAGTGPTPVEAGAAANRGVISWQRQSTDDTSFEQAVSESHYKDKWTNVYRSLAAYRPPPRTVSAMLNQGVISEELAVKYLKDYGVPDDALSAYTQKAQKTGVQKAHNITETEIIRLYTERGIDENTAKGYLIGIGYSERDAGLILAAADLDYHSKLSSATIAAVRAAYLHLHIDRNGVVTRLDALGLSSAYRDSLMELWDLEIQTGVKQLTVKQVLDIWGVGMISKETAELKLRQIGYSADDARFLIQLNSPGATPGAAAFAQFSNPGG